MTLTYFSTTSLVTFLQKKVIIFFRLVGPLILIFLGILVKFLREAHLIWCRNTPVDCKIIYNGASCTKVLLVIGGWRVVQILPLRTWAIYTRVISTGVWFRSTKAFLKNET